MALAVFWGIFSIFDMNVRKIPQNIVSPIELAMDLNNVMTKGKEEATRQVAKYYFSKHIVQYMMLRNWGLYCTLASRKV